MTKGRTFFERCHKEKKTKKLEIWVFPKIGVSQNGRSILEDPIKMDGLGVPLFLETPI